MKIIYISLRIMDPWNAGGGALQCKGRVPLVPWGGVKTPSDMQALGPRVLIMIFCLPHPSDINKSYIIWIRTWRCLLFMQLFRHVAVNYLQHQKIHALPMAISFAAWSQRSRSESDASRAKLARQGQGNLEW